MLPFVMSYLHDHWHELGMRRRSPRRFSYLMQRRNRVSVFVFVDSDPHPCFIVKLAPTEINRVSLLNEYEMMVGIHDLAPPEMRVTIPRPLALLTHGREPATIETVIPGTPMVPTDIFRGPSRAIEHQFELVGRWLLAFQSCCRQDKLVHGEVLEQAIVGPIERRLLALGLPADPQSGIRRLLALARDLQGCTLPLTYYHGDLVPSNILLDGRQITGVVDWEWAGRESLPTMDWFNFLHLFGWMSLLRRRTYRSFGVSRLDAVRLAFFDESPFAGLTRKWIVSFLSSYDFDVNGIPLLLLHALFELYPENAMLREIIVAIAKMTGNSFVPFGGRLSDS